MQTRSTLAIAATFTAEPLAPVLGSWLETLGLDAEVTFAPYNQVFQQLLDGQTLLARNQGLNALLVRFEDWMRGNQRVAHSSAEIAPAATRELPRYRLPNGLEVAHLNRDETEHLYRELFVNRAYLRHGVTLRDGAVIVDAGANIGMFSLFASLACRRPRILAFEPSPTVANLLRANAVLHDLDLKVFECGLADRNGEATFTYYQNFSVVSGFEADETEDAAFLRDAIQSSLARDGGLAVDQKVATELSAHLVNQRLAREQLVRPVRRLSDVLRTEAVETIDLLKIDVEKSELALIAGIDEADWSKVQQIVMEIHDRGDAIAASVARLERHGFDVVVEEEQDLRSTGVWNLFAIRPTYRAANIAARRARFEQIDRNARDFADAVLAAVPRTASPSVVITCPPSSFMTADPESIAVIARNEATLRERLAPVGIQVISGLESLTTYECPDYYDARGDELGHMPYTASGNALLATLVARAAHARLRIPAKVVIVDCDNTLWAGVCAEDGAGGVTIDAPHAALQRYLIEQQDSGVLICLCSKNEPADVWAVFDTHPDMILKREHVLASRINWQPKSQNLQDLAGELNLGLDSFVFIDDNPVECAEVRNRTPEVVTLQWPTNDRQAACFTQHVWRLDQGRRTEEDKRRTAMYKQEVARHQLQHSGMSLEAFLETLDLQTTIAPMTPQQLPRTAQMTERTNQFNFTTIRRSEAELRALATDGAVVEVVDVRDRFGDYGLVGAVITRVDRARQALVVDTLLLSCRVLGKGVEREVIRHLGRLAATEQLANVELPFRRTARNTPALAFAEALEAEKRDGESGTTVFVLETAAACDLPLKPASWATSDEPEPGERSLPPTGDVGRQAADSSVYQRIATDLTTTRRILELLDPSREATAHPTVDGESPHSELETRLAAIWAEQLRVSSVGVHDNFFEMGGDSIIAIQVMSRAAQSGIRLGMRDLFQHPTVSELARALTSRVATTPDVEAEDPTDHSIALTPIQEWFFEKSLPAPEHWNMEISARAAGPIDPGLLQQALVAVMTHHAALRFRFSPAESGWQQRLDPSPPPQLVETVDLTGLSQIRQQEAMREHAARTHAALNLSSGPLIRVVLFPLGASLSQILIIVHHLVIDGVSLRILVGDLETAYRHLAQGLAIRLPDASTTYARWARRLRSYAQSAELASQRDYWASVFDPAVPPLPVDHPSQRHEGRESDLEITPSLLTPEETQRLLQDLPRVLQTQINDVLLAALAQAFYQWSGHATLLVDLEGHGREALFDDVDLSRTVGWFTTIFPVRLQGDFSDTREALLAARAALRRIPSRGIGYGLLRYMSPDQASRSKLAECPPPDVMFNYLGQFDRASSPDTLFEIHDNVDFGPLHGPRGKRSHLFEIIARVVGGRLRLDWMYPRTAYRAESVARLIESYQAALRRAIALTQVSPGLVVSAAQPPAIDQIAGGRAVEEVCALSPIQDLFLAAVSTGASVGIDQWRLTLSGTLDEPLFRRAWQQTVQRHSILRTAIAVEGLAQPKQVVLPEASLEWHYEDWRHLDDLTRRAALDAFADRDRRRPIRLDRAPLMRIAVFRASDTESYLLWTFHHLIIDGWSCPLVFADVGAAYQGLTTGNTGTDPSQPTRYSDYVGWLTDQPTYESDEFWRHTLTGVTEPTPLPAALSASPARVDGRAEVSDVLDPGDTSALLDLTRRERVSLNTLVQLAWALVLSRHSGKRDVTFGVAFSGRPTELPGVERILGPFVNNLPVRITVDPSITAVAAGQAVQEFQFELSEHQFTPLARILGLASHSTTGRLFDSLLVLQGYTAADGLRCFGSQLEVSELIAPVQTNYPLTILAVPGEQLRVTIIARDGAYDQPSVQAILRDLTEALKGLSTPSMTVADVMARLSEPRAMRVSAKTARLRKQHPSPPRPGLETQIAAIWKRAFGLDDIGADENFFDLGGQSLLMIQVHRDLTDVLQEDLSIVTMFQFPTIRELAQHLGRPKDKPDESGIADRAKRQSAALARHRLRLK
jgi:FkbH-like protein/FkbM family methyltransferase/non-ribosomal peptide synthase protein (TIGR01720 family)